MFPSPVHTALTSHAPISIIGNAGFTKPDPVNGGGSGTADDPYIIENWDINASSANGINIENTTAHFIIRNCLVENGGSLYHAGIKLDNVVNGRVENCTSGNNYIGIWLSSSSNNTLTNNRCENNIVYGIRLYLSSNNTLTNNTCFNNWSGIYLYHSPNNTLTNNTCSNTSPNGIYLRYSDNNILSNNICSNNYDGICLEYSNNNTLSSNTCSYNSNGIYFEYSNNNILSNNTCSNSYNGIFLYLYSDSNRIKNNTVENNGYGIYIYHYTSGNRIYYNNFVNNGIQAYDNSSNYWDDGYPSGGNYWSDYAGVDENHGENHDIPGSDGIGDTPYYISGGSNLDRYPLMSPWAPIVRGVEVSISHVENSGPPGTIITFTITVTNKGSVSDTYSLTTADNAGWGPTISPSSLSLAAGASGTATLTVTIPSGAGNNARDNVRVIVTGTGVSAENSCIARAYIGPIPGVEVSISPPSQDGSPGTALTYTVTVRNTGSVADNYDLTVGDSSGWSPSLSPSTLSLAAGASGTATLTVTLGTSGTDTITVTATSQTDSSVSGSANCTARVVSVGGSVKVTIDPASKSGEPGESLNYSVTVKNEGTNADNFSLHATDTKGWGPTLSITSIPLAGGASRTGIRLSIKIPENAAGGDSTTITVTARGTGYENSATCTATANAGGASPLIYVGAAVVVVIIAAVLIVKPF